MNKIVKDDMPRYDIKRDLKNTLHDRQRVTETERQLKEKEAKRLALEKAKQLQAEKDIKEKEAKRLALEKAQIAHTPKTLDEVNTSGTSKNVNIGGKEVTEKGKPPHKKATKANQIKTSQNKGDKPNKGKLDTLLGDPMVSTKNSTYKTK